jgi:glyoxylase-like metal-dependent hydrolase (beta-lactamase superfamily II)
MIFRRLAMLDTGGLAYLLADADAREAVVIDAAAAQHAVVLALLDERDLRLRWVLRTHSHPGVEDGAIALSRRTGAALAGGARPARLPVDGDTFAFGGEIVRVLSTPGHTPDSLSYLWRDRLFSGDAIELGGFEPTAFAEVDAGRLYDSVVHRLFALPGETLVFPAHAIRGRTVSTIAEERLLNRCYVSHSRDKFIAAFGRRNRDDSPAPA